MRTDFKFSIENGFLTSKKEEDFKNDEQKVTEEMKKIMEKLIIIEDAVKKSNLDLIQDIYKKTTASM